MESTQVKPQNNSLSKAKIYTILIILLLLTSFLLALLRLEPPHTHTSSWGDRTRDYLIAHYTAQDGERPLLGYQGGRASSPVYYYLLAGFLKITDSVFFLGVVNIFFHTATIFLIYLIAKSLLGPFKALLSSIFFAVIPEVLQQTAFVFQPHQMQPFAYLALYLLIFSLKKNNFTIVLLSLTIVSFAGNLHSSAFAWIPVFLILIFWMMRKKRQRVKYYIAACFTLILSIGIFYLPVLAYYLKNPHLSNDLNINSIFPNPTQYFFLNLYHYFLMLTKTFSLNLTDNLQIDHLIAATLIIVCLIYYLFTQNKKAKTVVFIGICFVILPILLASLFSLNRGPLYYLYLTFGIFAVLITEIVISSANHILKLYPYKLRIFITLIIFLFLVKTISSDFAFAKPKKHPERLFALDGAVFSMEQEIPKIKNEKGFYRPNFFRIVAINHSLISNNPDFYYYSPLSTVFLVPLEKNLQTKLAKTSDGISWGITQINNDIFVFLICVEFYNKHFVEDCRNFFSQLYPNHRVIKNIYTRHPLSVYLTKKTYLMD